MDFIIIYSKLSHRIKMNPSYLQTRNRYQQEKESETGKKVKNYIYHYADKIGNGNFAKVYKGVNLQTNQIVAIKLVSLDELKSQHLEALVFEQIHVLQQFSHPNILRFIEAMLSERNCYIVTELCPQGSLDDRIKTNRPFTDQQLSTIIVDLWKGLKYMQQKGVAHRDLKPANIFISKGHMKIADFGLAKFYKERFHDLDIGSPQYMSPEGMILNCYSEKTDIWSFGILLYELLHGVTPFLFCKNQNQMKYCITRPLPEQRWRRDINPALRRLIEKMLVVDEYKRPNIYQLAQDPYLRQLLIRNGAIQGDNRMYQQSYKTQYCHPQHQSHQIQQSPEHTQHDLTPSNLRPTMMHESSISPKSKSMNNKISMSKFNVSPSRNMPLENSQHLYQTNNKNQVNGFSDHQKYSFSKKETNICVPSQHRPERPNSNYSSTHNGNYYQGQPISPIPMQHLQVNQPYFQPGIQILSSQEFSSDTNESEDDRRSPKRVLYQVKRVSE